MPKCPHASAVLTRGRNSEWIFQWRRFRLAAKRVKSQQLIGWVPGAPGKASSECDKGVRSVWRLFISGRSGRCPQPRGHGSEPRYKIGAQRGAKWRHGCGSSGWPRGISEIPRFLWYFGWEKVRISRQNFRINNLPDARAWWRQVVG